jgi:hypothetical protein
LLRDTASQKARQMLAESQQTVISFCAKIHRLIKKEKLTVDKRIILKSIFIHSIKNPKFPELSLQRRQARAETKSATFPLSASLKFRTRLSRATFRVAITIMKRENLYIIHTEREIHFSTVTKKYEEQKGNGWVGSGWQQLRTCAPRQLLLPRCDILR